MKIEISDRITEAYYGEMGEDLKIKTRERIHWICQNVSGDKVLDVGCSQGIVSIILGREGKSVVGIDIDESAIEFAKQTLSDENEGTKVNVSFECTNFINYNNDERFDTIILTEVLEHFTVSKNLILNSLKHLNTGGNIIITVPYGINDYIDHKKTYYFSNLFKELDEELEIVDYKLFGKWLGIVCVKQNDESKFDFDKELLSNVENAFYIIERNYLNEIVKLKDEITTLKSKLNDCNEKYKCTTQDHLNENVKFKDEIAILKNKLSDCNEKYRITTQSHVNEIARFKEEINSLKLKLNDCNEKYRYTTQSYTEINKKYIKLSEEFLEFKVNAMKEYELKLKEIFQVIIKEYQGNDEDISKIQNIISTSNLDFEEE